MSSKFKDLLEQARQRSTEVPGESKIPQEAEIMNEPTIPNEEAGLAFPKATARHSPTPPGLASSADSSGATISPNSGVSSGSEVAADSTTSLNPTSLSEPRDIPNLRELPEPTILPNPTVLATPEASFEEVQPPTHREASAKSRTGLQRPVTTAQSGEATSPALQSDELAASELATSDASPSGIAPRRGRPPGKRSHPDYEQISAYIAKRTHRDVKIALLQEGQGREFSELVEELLRHWLTQQ